MKNYPLFEYDPIKQVHNLIPVNSVFTPRIHELISTGRVKVYPTLKAFYERKKV